MPLSLAARPRTTWEYIEVLDELGARVEAEDADSGVLPHNHDEPPAD